MELGDGDAVVVVGNPTKTELACYQYDAIRNGNYYNCADDAVLCVELLKKVLTVVGHD